MTPYLEIPPEACRGRTIVVGDVHGCWDELAALLERLAFAPDDLLLCVGDLVDRGPDSWRVARFFRETPNAHTALGNHERRLARYVLHQGSVAWSQQHALSRLPRDQWEDWARWLLDRPAVIATPGVVVTHGRLDPAAPLDAQDPFHTCAVGGHMVHIEQDDDGVPLWIGDWPDPRPVCMGHLVYPRVELVPRRLYALDTGCCRGQSLTALVLPDFTVVAEPARANHAAVSWNQWQAERYGGLEEWPIARLVRLRKDLPSFPDRELAADLQRRVASLLDSVDLPGRMARLGSVAHRRWGEPPEPGPARGEYFRRLGGGCGGALEAALVRTAVAGRVPEWSHLLRHLEDTSVAQLVGILDDLASEAR